MWINIMVLNTNDNIWVFKHIPQFHSVWHHVLPVNPATLCNEILMSLVKPNGSNLSIDFNKWCWCMSVQPNFMAKLSQKMVGSGFSTIHLNCHQTLHTVSLKEVFKKIRYWSISDWFGLLVGQKSNKNVTYICSFGLVEIGYIISYS